MMMIGSMLLKTMDPMLVLDLLKWIDLDLDCPMDCTVLPCPVFVAANDFCPSPPVPFIFSCFPHVPVVRLPFFPPFCAVTLG